MGALCQSRRKSAMALYHVDATQAGQKRDLGARPGFCATSRCLAPVYCRGRSSKDLNTFGLPDVDGRQVVDTPDLAQQSARRPGLNC